MSVDRNKLSLWVESQLSKFPHLGLPDQLTLSPLSGDAGFRQYYRVNTEPVTLAVMAPLTPGVSDSAEYFSQFSTYLRGQGITTPAIFACDTERNYLLIECFDGVDLCEALSESSVDSLYGEALLALLKWQQIPTNTQSLALYDQSLLMKEMQLFPQWFVKDLLGYELSTDECQLIQGVFEYLADTALSQPQVLVHRDFHSRNLIYREGQALGVIDFQDAVIGPVTYDAVSLLRDCYVRWSPSQVKRWAVSYGNMAYEVGLLPAISTEQFMHWFDLMGLQRHIKVLGIFARLALRDGKSRYLSDLPLVIRYTLAIAQQYPQAQPFALWFEQRLLPIIERQSWYVDYRTAGDH